MLSLFRFHCAWAVVFISSEKVPFSAIVQEQWWKVGYSERWFFNLHSHFHQSSRTVGGGGGLLYVLYISLHNQNPLVKYGVRSPKVIWAPVYSCLHWLRPRNSPHLPPHLGSYTRSLLVSQDRRHLFETTCQNPLLQLTVWSCLTTTSPILPLLIICFMLTGWCCMTILICSGTDSPFRETSNVYDGSSLTADMAVQNCIGNVFSSLFPLSTCMDDDVMACNFPL